MAEKVFHAQKQIAVFLSSPLELAQLRFGYIENSANPLQTVDMFCDAGIHGVVMLVCNIRAHEIMRLDTHSFSRWM